MMIKKEMLVLLLFCFSQFFFSQTHRFTYEYRFKVDSTATDSLKVEWMNLDVNKEGSVYYSHTKFNNDSININSLIEQRKKTPGYSSINSYSKPWSIMYIVKKEYANHKTIWETSIMQTSLNVEENQPQKWEISQETQKIENYLCQKATTKFGGRNWEAWFTTEIPLQDGPYKFYGLPGLIVKLTDHTQTHQFLLKGNKKLTTESTYGYLEKLRMEYYGGEDGGISVNRKQYKKLWKEYVNDPVKDMRQELADPNYSIVIEKGGKKYTDKAEILKMQEESARNQLSKNNNPIELDLHQLKKQR